MSSSSRYLRFLQDTAVDTVGGTPIVAVGDEVTVGGTPIVTVGDEGLFEDTRRPPKPANSGDGGLDFTKDTTLMVCAVAGSLAIAAILFCISYRQEWCCGRHQRLKRRVQRESVMDQEGMFDSAIS